MLHEEGLSLSHLPLCLLASGDIVGGWQEPDMETEP